MAGLIDEVASYDNSGGAIGFTVFFYASEMYQNQGSKVQRVDDIQPATESIGAPKYPLVNDFYVVVQAGEPESRPTRQLRDWLLGAEGQAVKKAAGYAPVRG